MFHFHSQRFNKNHLFQNNNQCIKIINKQCESLKTYPRMLCNDILLFALLPEQPGNFKLKNVSTNLVSFPKYHLQYRISIHYGKDSISNELPNPRGLFQPNGPIPRGIFKPNGPSPWVYLNPRGPSLQSM